MSCSKPLPPCLCDLLYFLNRDQLERFEIVCHYLKKFIERYFQSKPCRVFEYLVIHRGSYALYHSKSVRWHPNRNDYSVKQFLAGQKCILDESNENNITFYPFANMQPYLGPTVRIKKTFIYVAGRITYNSEHITDMESLTYLWRDHHIAIAKTDNGRIDAEVLQPILNSPTILQCKILNLDNAHFSFKDYKVLYTIKIIAIFYRDDDIDPNNWLDFLEQPGVKPIVILCDLRREIIDNALDRLKEAFSSAVLPNAFKVVFFQHDDPLTVFRETNNTFGEKLELKKGPPAEFPEVFLGDFDHYTLERSTI